MASIALARPKVAIAPFEGDQGDKASAAVGKAISDDADVTSSKATGRAMASLDLSGELDKKDLKRLRGKLEVDVIVQGKVTGKKQKTLELHVAGKGVKTATFSIKFKSALSTKFRDDVRDELGKHLGTGGGDDEDDEDAAKKKRLADDEDEARKKKHAADDEEEARKKRKHAADGDEDDGAKKHKRVASDEDDDGREVRTRKKHHRDDDEDSAPARHRVTQVAVRANAGVGFARRTLTYAGAGMMKPPSVGTAGAEGTFQAEVYPGATSTLTGIAAAIGVYGEYDKSFGVKIPVPGTKVTSSIDEAHYAIGLRYRIPIGEHSLALGAAYARWHYIADRSGLMTPTALDMPDVDYAALAPGAVMRIAAGDDASVYIGADAMLLLGAGPIVETANYGFADIIAFDVTAGLDYALGANYALRLGVDFTQFGLSFQNKGMSRTRGVSSATDRLLGVAATFAVTY